MDADSWLAAISLGLSLVFYAALFAGEGYLLSGPVEGGEANHRRALSMRWEGGVRALAKVVLTIWAAASASALLLALTGSVALVVLGNLGLLVLLVLLQGLSAGAGARWGAGARLLLLPLRPLALLVAPLSWLHGSVVTAFSRGRPRATGASAPPAPLADGPYVAFPESPGEEMLDPYERRMITSILKLDETAAREIMVPRMDILAAEAALPPKTVAELMWDSGHSRIPIYEETVDNIVGVVHSRDLLRHLASGESQASLASIARPPLFIPDSKRLDELLRDFQERHIQIAIVVDEYGGVAGLVTIEDLLEEIVGEIEDEFDTGDPLTDMVGEDEAVMDARISLEDVNQVFSVNLRGEGFDTLGGLLYQQMGKIPSPGDETMVDGLRIKVLTTLGRRIKKVQVARAPTSDTP